MKISDAIRLGSMLRLQGFGSNRVWLDSGEIRTCALGAAEEALGYEITANNTAFTMTRASCPVTACPHEMHRYSDVGMIITHLNDKHRWTREAIADWVETIENRDTITDIKEVTDEHARTTAAV